MGVLKGTVTLALDRELAVGEHASFAEKYEGHRSHKAQMQPIRDPCYRATCECGADLVITMVEMTARAQKEPACT